MNIGEKIQTIRKTNMLSQEEFAEKLGVSRQAISKWELGDSIPDIAKIALISKTFKISTDSIIFENIDLNEKSSDHPSFKKENDHINQHINGNGNENEIGNEIGIRNINENRNEIRNEIINGITIENKDKKAMESTKFVKAVAYTGKTAKKYIYIIGYVLVIFGIVNLVLSAILGMMWSGFSNELSSFLLQYNISLSLNFLFWIFVFMAVIAAITLGIGILIAVKGKRSNALARGAHD